MYKGLESLCLFFFYIWIRKIFFHIFMMNIGNNQKINEFLCSKPSKFLQHFLVIFRLHIKGLNCRRKSTLPENFLLSKYNKDFLSIFNKLLERLNSKFSFSTFNKDFRKFMNWKDCYKLFGQKFFFPPNK